MLGDERAQAGSGWSLPPPRSILKPRTAEHAEPAGAAEPSDVLMADEPAPEPSGAETRALGEKTAGAQWRAAIIGSRPTGSGPRANIDATTLEAMRKAQAQNAERARDREQRIAEAKREALSAAKRARQAEEERRERARAAEEAQAKAAKEAAAAARAQAAKEAAKAREGATAPTLSAGMPEDAARAGAGGTTAPLPSPRTPGGEPAAAGASEGGAGAASAGTGGAVGQRSMPEWLKAIVARREAEAAKAAQQLSAPQPAPAAAGGRPSSPGGGAEEAAQGGSGAQSSSSSSDGRASSSSSGSEADEEEGSRAAAAMSDESDAPGSSGGEESDEEEEEGLLEVSRAYALFYDRANKEWRYLVSAQLPELDAAAAQPDSAAKRRPAAPAPPLPPRVWALESHIRSDEMLAAFEARLGRQVLPELLPEVGALADVRNVDTGFLWSWSRATIIKARKPALPRGKAAAAAMVAAAKSRPAAGAVHELDEREDAIGPHWLVEYSDFISPDGTPLQEVVPPSRLRQPAACAPPGWLPSVSEVVEVMQDDVWWEAHVLEVERVGTGTRPSGRLLLRNRMTWETSWFDASVCRPSAAHLEFMRARITALDTRAPPARELPAPVPQPAAAAGKKSARNAPPAAGLKRGRGDADGAEYETLRAEAATLLQDMLADEQASADLSLVRAALEAALLVGAHGSAVEEAQRRLAT